MIAKLQDSIDARWDDVRIFLAARRHGTLGVAAVRVGLDVSTMSRRLTGLEASLGVRLFDRTRTGLLPTRAAERMTPAAEAMEAAHGRLTRDVSDLEALAEGTVRLSAAPGLADLFVAPTLVKLRAQHPKIRIELDASVRAIDLTRHEADLALRSMAPRGEELVVTKLGSARWVPVGAPALVKKLGRLESWSDAPWINWDRDLASFAPARWVARHASKAELVLRTSHFTSQLIAAETGLGLVLVPTPYLTAKRLVQARFSEGLRASVDEWPSDDLWLVGHRALRDVPRVAAVWKFFADEMRRTLPKEARLDPAGAPSKRRASRRS